MSKYITSIVFCLIASLSHGQVHISISIKNINLDTIRFGHNLGKRMNPIYTAVKEADENYHIRKKTHETGVFTLAYTRDKASQEVKRVAFFIDENNTNFSINVDGFLTNKASFVGSEDNTILQSYITKHDSISTIFKRLKDRWLIMEDDATFDAMANAEYALRELNKTYIAATKNNYLKQYFESTKVDFPTYTGTLADKKKQRQDFYDLGFANNFNFKYKMFWQVDQTIDLFDMLTIYGADADHTKVTERSVNLLNQLWEKHLPGAQYYLNYLLNSFPKMTKYNYDFATIALQKEYLSRPDHGVSEEKIKKVNDAVERTQRMAPGQILPDITLYKEDGSPMNLYSASTGYTVFLVWSPDCGHCKKELPALKRVCDEFKSNNIKVVTTCLKKGDDIQECYNYLRENNMMDAWYNLNNKDNKSNFVALYDASSFPMMIIIDKDKKIVMRRKGEVEEIELKKIFSKLL